MNSDKRTAYATRDALLKLLSDEEMAKVSTAETSALTDGDEYLDLEHLDKGVLQAKGKTTPITPIGHVLAKKAVHEKKWNAILAQLATAVPARS